VKLVLVGDTRDEYSRRVSQAAKKLIAKGLNVSIFPHTHEINDFYEKSSVVLLTSKSESYPRVILEALQFGIPAIASDVGGVRELIHHGFNGLIFEKNDRQGLLDAIIEFMDDEVLEIFQVNAKVSVQRLLSEDEGAAQITLLMAEVFSKHHTRRRRED
jgi:glycosyltransferase involved in cell wall biosynthesis